MKSPQEFEVITDKNANYKVFLNVLKYRSPHMHLDYEIGYVMVGSMDLIYEENTFHLKKGDFMCVNPYQIHEFRSQDNVQLLLLQVNPSYFSHFCPQLQNMEFTHPVIHSENCNGPHESSEESGAYISAYRNLFELAKADMERKPDYELRCSGLLNLLFYDLMTLAPHKNASHSESISAHNKATRVRHIADYINSHIDEKVLLSDLADYEGLTPAYLSHFFRDNFGMTFQEYVTKLRCEKARSLMLTTDLSLLDISISCGFSDPKYFKNGFQKQYGYSPRDYRFIFSRQKLSGQQTSMLTTQQILSRQTSLVLLQQFIDQNPMSY